MTRELSVYVKDYYWFKFVDQFKRNFSFFFKFRNKVFSTSMNSICFPGALNPFCRQSICLSSCSDQVALGTSSSLVYLYSYTDQKLIFQTKFTPHSKVLSCMTFHPTNAGLLVTGGTPNSRINLWSIQEKTISKKSTFTLQRVSRQFRKRIFFS